MIFNRFEDLVVAYTKDPQSFNNRVIYCRHNRLFDNLVPVTFKKLVNTTFVFSGVYSNRIIVPRNTTVTYNDYTITKKESKNVDGFDFTITAPTKYDYYKEWGLYELGQEALTPIQLFYGSRNFSFVQVKDNKFTSQEFTITGKALFDSVVVESKNNVVFTDCTNVRIVGLKIYGYSTEVSKAPLEFYNCTNMQLTKCAIKHSYWSGVLARGCNNFKIRKSTFTHCYANAIQTVKCDNVTIQSCVFGKNSLAWEMLDDNSWGSCDIKFSESLNCFVETSKFKTTYGNNVWYDYLCTGRVYLCDFVNNTYQPVIVEGCLASDKEYSVLIENNKIGGEERAIFLQSARDVHIVGNVLYNKIVIQDRGITIDGKRLVVENNRITDNVFEKADEYIETKFNIIRCGNIIKMTDSPIEEIYKTP